MAAVITYEEAKRLVLQHLYALLRGLPEPERYKPMYVIRGVVLSLVDLIKHVEMDTEIGRYYVYQWCQAHGYIIK